MNKFVENWCIGTGSGGTVLASVSIAEVKDVISIVFLCIQIAVLILGITIKFFKYYSNDGKIDKEEAKDLIDDITKIEDKIKEDQKNDRN